MHTLTAYALPTPQLGSEAHSFYHLPAVPFWGPNLQHMAIQEALRIETTLGHTWNGADESDVVPSPGQPRSERPALVCLGRGTHCSCVPTKAMCGMLDPMWDVGKSLGHGITFCR